MAACQLERIRLRSTGEKQRPPRLCRKSRCPLRTRRKRMFANSDYQRTFPTKPSTQPASNMWASPAPLVPKCIACTFGSTGGASGAQSQFCPWPSTSGTAPLGSHYKHEAQAREYVTKCSLARASCLVCTVLMPKWRCPIRRVGHSGFRGRSKERSLQTSKRPFVAVAVAVVAASVTRRSSRGLWACRPFRLSLSTAGRWLGPVCAPMGR